MRMPQLELTTHSLARLRQRGMRETDAQLILELGTEIWPAVFMMTDQDADRLIAELSSSHGSQYSNWHGLSVAELKRRFDSLRGSTVIADGLTLITVFHKLTPGLRTDPRRDPRCRRRRQRREADRRRRSFHIRTVLE
jgi:hypothetical protein